MYCIIVYDISGEKVVKVCHFLRRYMNWIQNSVFEGELTKSQLYNVKTRLKKIIDTETDTLIIYTINSQKEIAREQIGTSKRSTDRII